MKKKVSSCHKIGISRRGTPRAGMDRVTVWSGAAVTTDFLPPT